MSSVDPSEQPRQRLGALDGLRALAVAAVVVYHIDDRVLPGGFLGVDVFFVLSGYLVTTLLVREHARSGSIGLRAFWGRRARRLWAAAWIVLAFVAVAGLWDVWGPDRQAVLPGEIFAAVAHIENYWLLSHGGYLQQFAAPSPVRHFWSLAVEEQFYFFWPLVMVGGLALAARLGRRAMWAVLVLIGAASITVAQFVSPERAYLGTASRMIALVVGALLAWWWSSTPLAAPRRIGLRRAVVVWAALGVVVLVAGALVLHPYDEVMARGGFLTVALAAAGLVGLAVIPGRFAAAMAVPPLVWIGRRSYGIYLLHWPLIVAMGPGRSPWVVAAVVVPLAVGGAAVLHNLVEVPLILRRRQPVRMAQGSFCLAVVVVVALIAARPVSTATGVVAAGLAELEDPAGPSGIVTGEEAAPVTSVLGATTSTTSTTSTTVCVPAPIVPGPLMGPGGGYFDPSTITDIADPSSAWSCQDQIDVLVVGDSTGRGFSNGLASLNDPGLRVWDRTILGCSLGGEDCGSWRDEWTAPIDQIDPDVVVLYFNPVADLKGVDDAEFLSPEGVAQREQVLNEAADLLSRNGAALVFVAPPTPRPPNGLFFCDGRKRGTQCDPEWVEAWTESVARVAVARDAPLLDVGAYVESLPDDEAARPDGMHFAGASLSELARQARPLLSLAVIDRNSVPVEVKGG
jgi:peptidoglycan/LPS O-acetylase OafA/YrhL